MTTIEYRDLRDRQRGTNRQELYGSDRAYYPFPSKLSSMNSTKLGTPGKLIRESKEYSTRNYDNLVNMLELSKLFS